MNEQWREVPDFPDYEVSDQGRVRSYRRSQNPRLLRPGKNSDGYPTIVLSNGSRTTFGVHVLVLLAFVGPRPEGMLTRHLDGDNTNNVLTNLAYGTPHENNEDTIRHGRHNMASKVKC